MERLNFYGQLHFLQSDGKWRALQTDDRNSSGNQGRENWISCNRKADWKLLWCTRHKTKKWLHVIFLLQVFTFQKLVHIKATIWRSIRAAHSGRRPRRSISKSEPRVLCKQNLAEIVKPWTAEQFSRPVWSRNPCLHKKTNLCRNRQSYLWWQNAQRVL